MFEKRTIINWTAHIEEKYLDEPDEDGYYEQNYLVICVNDTEVFRKRMQTWYRYPEDAFAEALKEIFENALRVPKIPD